jgi:NADH:ubiquinone oxidoreductase subunit 5 (subunit L)/multisubunit Na+/H+ antiporter MnhA subunit
MVIVEWIGLMALTGLIIFLIAGFWVLKEQGDFIITYSSDWKDWLAGVIVAIVFIFGTIWTIFVIFYNEPESFGYEKIIVEEAVDAGNEP